MFLLLPSRRRNPDAFRAAINLVSGSWFRYIFARKAGAGDKPCAIRSGPKGSSQPGSFGSCPVFHFPFIMR